MINYFIMCISFILDYYNKFNLFDYYNKFNLIYWIIIINLITEFFLADKLINI